MCERFIVLQTFILRITIVPIYPYSPDGSIVSAEQPAYFLTLRFGSESIDDSVDDSVKAFGDVLQP